MADAHGEFRPDLSPVDTQHVSLCEALNRILNKGVVVVGEATISVADIDLIYVGLQLVVTSIETARGSTNGHQGSDFWGRESGRTNGKTEHTGAGGRSSPPQIAQSADRNDPPPPTPMKAHWMNTVENGQGTRMNLRRDKAKNGLAQLALTIVRLVHELLKHQATRRVEGGSLSDAEIERLGVTLMRQAQEIENLRKEFGLTEEDLNIDLGPVGKLL